MSLCEFEDRYDIVDEPCPRNSLMSGHYKRSFAYYTLQERLPITLTAIIDALTKNKDDLAKLYGEDTREEIKLIISKLSHLKYQLATDKHFEKFLDNEPDAESWNKFLETLPEALASFFQACWLYSECYMYRKVSSFFEATTSLKDYDYFAQQKQNALIISVPAIEGILPQTRNLEKSAEKFIMLMKLNLWGNRCDLSITSGQEVVPLCQSLERINEFDSFIIANSAHDVWNKLEELQTKEHIIVDFVCDNAGFEFFTDLLMAEYLLEKHLAHKIRFHVKAIPWYISDVTHKDVEWTLKFLKEHATPSLREAGDRWTHYLQEGKFEIMPTEYFWTSPYEYYKMRDVANHLYEILKQASLIIFKGDLNYRKLLGDVSWDPTEVFLTCLRGFRPSNLCTLRTVKADLICGLKKDQFEELDNLDSEWMTTGEYGVIQFAAAGHCGCNDDK